MKYYKLLIVFLFSLHYTQDVLGQPSRLEDFWTVGIQVNALNYFGDMNPINRQISTEISFTRPSFGIELTKKIGARFHLRGGLMYGRLRGDDFVAADPGKQESAPRYGRNLHFRNDIVELSLVGIYEIFPSRGRFYRRRYFTPYVFAGIAGFYHNPKAKTPTEIPAGLDVGVGPGEWVALRPLRTEGQGLPTYGEKQYSLIQPAIPIGAGFRWRITDRIDASFELGFRILLFDYIDDVSGEYPDIRDLESDLARLLYDRSAEPIAAVKEEARNLEQITPQVGGVSTLYGSTQDLENLVDLSGQGFSRLTSYGLRGDKRGTSSQNDVYLVTGFRITYVLRTIRRPRYQQP